MNTFLFLNIPNNKRIMRRYMCSYNSPTFLFQPIELLCLAAISKDLFNYKTYLLDAIAENKESQEVYTEIKSLKPDYIVCLSGFECFEDDINELNCIKEIFPDIKIVLFGYYPTLFPEITMGESKVDYLIHGEPDLIFKDFLRYVSGDMNIEIIQGISYRIDGSIIHQKSISRIPNPNELPMPAFDLLKNNLYNEPFFPKPFALLQSARGCPYQCNYCVKSYGTKLTMLTPENIINQIERNIELFNIRSFRFIDDTFTAVPKQVIAFCKILIERNYNLVWSCLARPDTLDKEMLQWMRKAGCKRLYIGIESGSEKVLEYYNKRVDLDMCSDSLSFAKSIGYELMGLFMIGAPIEGKEELNHSIDFAIKNKFDFITVGELIPYPGTSLYERLKEEIDFSLMPYKNEFKDENFEIKVSKYQKIFFKNFYFRIAYLKTFIIRYFLYLPQILQNFMNFIRFIFSSSFDKKRKDLI